MGVKIGQNNVNFPYNKIYIGSNLVYELNIIITFTIAETAYQAEEGMTWGEWVESKYNTCNATLKLISSTGSYRVYIGESIVTGEDGIYETSQVSIIKDFNYKLYTEK